MSLHVLQHVAYQRASHGEWMHTEVRCANREPMS